MLRDFFHEYDFLPLAEDAEWLYYSGYWDGPLSGMVIWNGEKFWVVCYYDDNDVVPGGSYGDIKYWRYFVLLRLSDKDMKEEEERHKFWNECCGNYSFDTTSPPSRPSDDYYVRYPPNSQGELTGEPIARMEW